MTTTNTNIFSENLAPSSNSSSKQQGQNPKSHNPLSPQSPNVPISTRVLKNQKRLSFPSSPELTSQISRLKLSDASTPTGFSPKPLQSFTAKAESLVANCDIPQAIPLRNSSSAPSSPKFRLNTTSFATPRELEDLLKSVSVSAHTAVQTPITRCIRLAKLDADAAKLGSEKQNIKNELETLRYQLQHKEDVQKRELMRSKTEISNLKAEILMFKNQRPVDKSPSKTFVPPSPEKTSRVKSAEIASVASIAFQKIVNELSEAKELLNAKHEEILKLSREIQVLRSLEVTKVDMAVSTTDPDIPNTTVSIEIMEKYIEIYEKILKESPVEISYNRSSISSKRGLVSVANSRIKAIERQLAAYSSSFQGNKSTTELLLEKLINDNIKLQLRLNNSEDEYLRQISLENGKKHEELKLVNADSSKSLPLLKSSKIDDVAKTRKIKWKESDCDWNEGDSKNVVVQEQGRFWCL